MKAPSEQSKSQKRKISPVQLGFRLPAEWEHHEATWLAWPHNHTDWPGKFGAIQWVYGEIVRKLVSGELVRIIVQSKDREHKVRKILSRVGVDLTQVEFFRIPTNRGWTRDFGPLLVKQDKPKPEVAVTKWQFTAWARYSDWEKDSRVPLRLASQFDWRIFPAQKNNVSIVLEGGSIDVNGTGTLLTTEECLLDSTTQVRNPKLDRKDMEHVLADYFAATNVLWLGRGIAGDDTHGHVDDICRFVNTRTVILCQERNPNDVNYRPLCENRERLEGMRLEDGTKVEIVPLPMPAPLYLDGRRLPASYANFYISNAGVLVPTFNDPQDRVALGILSELFQDRPLIGIHAVDLVWGLGTIHCLTQQQPSIK